MNAEDWKHWAPSQANPVPLPLSVLLRLEASKLVSPTPATADPTVMAPDGTGLHSALANMALNDPDSWQALQANLRRIIPSIRRLRHTKTANVHQPASLLFDTVGADSVPAHQVSEGTLLVLGLLAALHASGRPSFVLLDDLDRGLHPKAQKELIALLRGLLETNPDLQILATTHSPYLLDCMKPSEVRMTFLGDDGATVCAALANHPKFGKWKDEMSAGEMWGLFGEKWLVEQGAAS
jgi:predicted ATPase